MNKRFGRLALHTWTLDTTPLVAAIEAARGGGFDAMELRRVDFKRAYESGLSNGRVLDLVREGGLPVCCLGVEYGWMFATGVESARLFDDFRVSCANAVALGCSLLMSAPGTTAGPLSDAIANTRRAAEIAGEHGLRLAIEFNSTHEVLNSTAALGEILIGARADNCGILLDAYHLERLGRGGRGFEEVPAEQIFHFQFSDVPSAPPAGERRPVDRLPPGHGVVRWNEVFGLLAEKGYTGYLSYEAPNPELWARAPLEVATEAVAATRRMIEEVAVGQS